MGSTPSFSAAALPAESRLGSVSTTRAGVAVAASLALGSWVLWRGLQRLQKPAEVYSALAGQPAAKTCNAPWLLAAPGPKPRIVLVATGSVASVKVPELAATLCSFAEVAVVLTGPGNVMASRVANSYAPARVFEWELLRRDGQLHVLKDEDEWEGYESVAEDKVLHVELRKWADVAVVAPCSANTLAKITVGLCDNLATCLLRAWGPAKPVVLAPAMNTVMWEHPMTAVHLKTLSSWGFRILPPASKRLACGDVGRGALPSVADVVAEVRRAVEGFEARRARSETGAWQARGFEEWTADDGGQSKVQLG